MGKNLSLIKKLINLWAILGALAIVYVFIDFSFNQAKPEPVNFEVPLLQDDKPVILKNEKMMIIAARYSDSQLAQLQSGGRLSKISSSFRQEEKAIDGNGFFIAKGYGTHIGCPLEIGEDYFKESCSDAYYDWLGNSRSPGLYKNLEKVDYRFSQKFTVLTIY